ncbi:putative receptor-like protein kinase [Acorus gramineus]|uniref:non-specific serine/threonine protein kinase n=1 Tax=Acorus gramineus TaxID=55184 RepID=A0AAV9B1M0_ACOGR|nr:putative receptor-like protein kinase [Acorus gramineus]
MLEAMDLNNNNFTGSIPPSIGSFSSLSVLYIGRNCFQGSIPNEIGSLSRLQYFNLSYNSLDGKIPTTLGHCSKLQNISIRSNNLVGQIPDTLGRLPNLKVLSLATNNLIGDVPQSLGNLSSLNILNLAKNSLTGLLPSSLGNLSSLSYFDLSSNNLNGSIPEDIAHITGLKFFSVSINGFSGLIPSPYFNLSSLQHFAVSVNQLTGTLPQDIGLTLPNLEDLLVDVNQFHGPIPISLSNASRLQVVDLDTNKFSGRVPLNLGSLQNLRNLNLGSNKLRAREAEDWDFITSLTNCSNLVVLGLNNNSFTGVLPSSIANLSSELQWLVMGGNQISGGIPAGIENLVNLVVLGMDQNNFTGAIPGAIGKLQWLNALDLSENRFSVGKNEFWGSIPSSLRNCQNLEALELSNNNFSGTIPIEVFNITSLSIYLDLSHNSLIGTLPMQIGSLTNLGILDVSENRLSGEIPNELGDCQVLEYLYMEGNFFQGSIPPSFGKLKGIRELDLSRNKFSGQFPDFLENLHSAQYLNLSFNNFNGEVPQGGVFNNASAISVAGNNNLCGGIPKLQLPPCPNKSSKRRKQHLAVIIMVPVVSILCSIVLLYFCIICWTKSSKAKIPSTPSSSDQHKKVSYAELYKATDGFSSENLMGVGSFGSVYKGIMDLGETAVAVKVFNLQRRGATKTFLAECEALRFVRHRNLVKILTSCSSMDFMGNEFKALVYEFMPHGSLENWLHPVGKEWCQSESLNFSKRLNIAIDVASALNYLHYHCLKPIVHCDLKPSNVLLDGTMSALVSDFGLARFLSKTFAPSGQTISIGIKGTIGYVAPGNYCI